MEWTVTSAVLAMLRAEAAAAHPLECCGLLLGRGGAITGAVPAANVAGEPWHRFEIDPAVLIAAHRAARAGGPQVLGYYHSHPTGVARPSATDRGQAAGDGRVWAIVAGCDVSWWRDDEPGFAPLPCSVVES